MGSESAARDRGIRKTKVGRVVSDGMDKTVVVKVERVVMHDMYKKYTKRWTSYKAHDEKNEFHVGDKVEIMETRPLSREKRWRVIRLIERPAIR